MAAQSSFQNGEVTQTAILTVKIGNDELKSVYLTRPAPDEKVIEQDPAQNESKRLYLPKGTKLQIPEGAVILFVISATVKTESGSCSLGKSEKEIDPVRS